MVIGARDPNNSKLNYQGPGRWDRELSKDTTMDVGLPGPKRPPAPTRGSAVGPCKEMEEAEQ